MKKEKKGLLQRLIGSNKNQKGSCCSFKIEEIIDNPKNSDSSQKNNNCCSK